MGRLGSGLPVLGHVLDASAVDSEDEDDMIADAVARGVEVRGTNEEAGADAK